ncbi:MAG: mannonate dehydratase [Puniceicoccales bacterium]|jgi:mannonate dehydratase|nr:mannonate dehydratase [Puniceicoccales bacterium]
MALEKTWRWFGWDDPVTLKDIRQIGIEGIVTSLHTVPAGEAWKVEEINHVQSAAKEHGMHWSVVESLPVAEGIKIHSKEYDRLAENYCRSLRNIANCGIDTVCYNFMPVLDWARTHLHYKNERGGETMLFDYPTFAVFDVHILKREHAENDYPEHILQKADQLAGSMSEAEKEELAYNIIVVTQAFIHGSVGGGNDYKRRFLAYLDTYREIRTEQLRKNLSLFLRDILPVAEETGIRMCIHPDDPPFPLLGLPRIAGTADDFHSIFSQNNSSANALTFCTGSLSARTDNDVTEMARRFADKIHFIHLRNTAWLTPDSFYESGHLVGSVDMYSVMKILLEEQLRREKSDLAGKRMPFRSDHGIRILDDYSRAANPGYPLIGRLKGVAELDGLQTGIERALRRA